MDPMKYIVEEPTVTRRIARWQMLLTEYDIQYVTQKAIKGSVLEDYLAHHPTEDYQPIRFDFRDEDIMVIRHCETPGTDEEPESGSRWKLVFGGSSNSTGHGIGAIITSPTGYHIPFTARLCFTCTNNMAEYEACILGFDESIDLRIKILKVYGDSALVINQIKGEWGTRNSKIIRYQDHVRKMITYFDEITFHYIPRKENQLVDALATLSSIFKVKWYNKASIIRIY
ncbi:uncharacterized protein LOC127108835 [Lathyrus oleraceus]|uniref:uncharacterized protein LOC127108835 n=1 Tax=Pisum sativum TaxID=3888 RepID=UPI0021D28280|nr:uncharacterized protein LOC127108835 [Pisum sativum]